jgi:hypothetical protein
MQPELPEDTVMRDWRVRLRMALKRFLMRAQVHRLLGYRLTTALFKLLDLEAA